MGYTATVTGGTGAIGRDLVAELLASPAWSRVTVVGRRPWSVPPGWEGKIDAAKEEQSGRLVQVKADMEALCSAEASKDFEADAGFCCLGTTHGDAGSSAAFRRVDLDYVAASAKLAKAGGAKYFSHVTASGTGGFLAGLTNYGRTKKAAEDAIKAVGFPAATIFRPGMLDRGDKLRSNEKIAMKVLPSIKVGAVARAMRIDAEKVLGQMEKGDKPPAWKIVEDSEITR